MRPTDDFFGRGLLLGGLLFVLAGPCNDGARRFMMSFPVQFLALSGLHASGSSVLVIEDVVWLGRLHSR